MKKFILFDYLIFLDVLKPVEPLDSAKPVEWDEPLDVAKPVEPLDSAKPVDGTKPVKPDVVGSSSVSKLLILKSKKKLVNILFK